MIRQPVQDLRGRQSVALELLSEFFGHHENPPEVETNSVLSRPFHDKPKM
jgi:hypothetical protein